jgi:AcrR family transcriptional regulator
VSSKPRTETQRRILQATREAIEATGSASLRLEDVAERAGVSRQAVYLNFGSRTGLLVELVAYLDEDLAAWKLGEAVRNAASGVASLEAFLAAWIRHLPRILPFARALLAERSRDEAADAAWRDRMAAFHALCSEITHRLAEEGTLASPWTAREAADWLWGLASIQLYETMAERGWGGRRYADRLGRVARAALVAL